jgi:cell wall-associated NlpC family hydrolase
MSAMGADNAWAIFAPPPGVRDLALTEYWERSLARSRRRREAAARQTVSTRKVIPAAMAAAMIVGGGGAVAQAQSPTATATGFAGNLHRGSRGPAVAAAQRALGIPADGIFGRQTRRAVRAFQAAHGLVVDGIIGPVTSAALHGASGVGRVSDHVRVHLPAATTMALQRALGISADGVYGPQTRRAVRAYQSAHGLTVDGIAGPQTLGALGISGSTAPAPVSSGSGALTAVAAARSQIGTPYRVAGTAPGGFDCSGLVQWAFGRAGISLPRTSFSQFGVGTPVSRAAIQAGDLVFFNTDGGGASHVGIADSASTVISATTHGVREHAIGDSYWGAHYVGARRVG